MKIHNTASVLRFFVRVSYFSRHIDSKKKVFSKIVNLKLSLKLSNYENYLSGLEKE